MTSLTCIVCPRGCRLLVDEENGMRVTGFSCPKGEAYGREELLNPVRVLTSAVRITGAVHRRCPVRTDGAIPKGKMMEAMRLLDGVTLASPVKRGQTVIEDLLGTGVRLIATRDM